MYGGMTRKEVHVLAALIVVIAAGLAVRAWEERLDTGAYVLVEQDRHWVPRQSQGQNHSPPRAYSAKQISPSTSAGREMYVDDGRLDLNRADATALDALPRIGPSRADAIIKWRQQNGFFASTEDLLKIHGIGEKTLDLLEPLIFVDSTVSADTEENRKTGAVKQPGTTLVPKPESDIAPATAQNTETSDAGRIDINSAGQEKLESLWNIGPAKARAIIEWRRTNGTFRNIEQLQEVQGIGPSTLERNRDRLICR